MTARNNRRNNYNENLGIRYTIEFSIKFIILNCDHISKRFIKNKAKNWGIGTTFEKFRQTLTLAIISLFKVRTTNQLQIK